MVKELDFRKGAVPLYIQIQRILKEQILQREYAPGEMIPSEAQLQTLFHVSRITARQAIAQLEREGLVERARGKGTKVIFQNKIQEELKGVKSFTQEMIERGITPGTSYAHIEMVCAQEQLSQIFGCQQKELVYRLARVRTGDGLPIVYFETYFAKEHNLPLDDEKYQGSLYDLLDELHIHKPVRSKESFYAIVATKEIASKLEMEKGEAILVRQRISYDENDHVLEFTKSYYPGDRYSYLIYLER